MQNVPVTIADISIYDAPPSPVSGLLGQGLTEDELARLQADGFETYRQSPLAAWQMASEALRRMLETSPQARTEVGVVVFASESVFDPDAPPKESNPPRLGVRDDLVRAVASNRLFECDISGAWLNGCANSATAFEYLNALLGSRGYSSGVLVTTDRFGQAESRLVPPKRTERMKLHGVGSDVATAVRVVRGSEGRGPLRYLSSHFASSSKNHLEHELIGQGRNDFAYIVELAKLARRAATVFAKSSGVRLGDVEHVVFGNYLRSELNLFLTGLGVTEGQLRMSSKKNYGHAVSSDSFLTLHEALGQQLFRPGDRIALVGLGPFSIGITLLVYEGL